MAPKSFKLSAAQIRPVVPSMGSCIATDKITVDGEPVRFMYREEPETAVDSGWRFMAGTEDDAYMDDPSNHAVYDVNTIANYDAAIVPLLGASAGSAFERAGANAAFVAAADWQAPAD